MSEKGVRMVSKHGRYVFHATLEHNSYVFRPNLLPTSSRILHEEEIVLAASVIPSHIADLWHFEIGSPELR